MTDRRPGTLVARVPSHEGEPASAPLTTARRAELYTQHRPAVFDLLVRRLRNVEEAEALTQDALLRALDAADREPLRSFAAFALRVASNLAIDALRRRRLEVRGGDPEEVLVAEVGPETLDLRRVRGAVGELEPSLRDVVELRYVDGFSFAEIALRLRMSKNGVFARHERALDELRAALARSSRSGRRRP